MWTAYCGAVVRLYEPAILMTSGLGSAGVTADAARRTEFLWSCLEAIGHYFTAFLVIPVDQLETLPLTTIAHTSFVIVTATRLLLLEDPAWDSSVARKSLDLAASIFSLEQRFQAAAVDAAAGEARVAGRRERNIRYDDESRSLAAALRDKMRWVRQWYLGKLADDLGAAAGPAAAAEPGGGMEMDAGFAVSVDEIDAAFWDSFLDIGPPSWGPTNSIS